MENLQVNSSNLGIYTDPNTYAITVSSDVNVNSSGLSTVDIRNFKKYLFSTGNKGSAFDIGASYKITPRWTVDASVIDIGGITWSRDAKNFRTADPSASYTYFGSPIQSVINDSTKATGIITHVLDSVQNSFRVKESETTYTTKLNPTIFLTGRYSVNQFLFASAIVQARKKFDTWTPTFGLSLNGRVGTYFDLALHYTYNKDIKHNFGGGAVFYFGNASIMLLSDNISGAIRYKDTRFLNFRAGVAFHFGKYFVDKDKDDDDIPDDEDKCPTVAGPPETNGCPDTDGDKIIDIEDDCPKEPGPKTLNGCPDRDNDGIIDKFDDCPELAGEAEFKGCPDRDHDGIMDVDDKCPLDPGSKELKGCPDRDGDGIGDGDDLCPDKKGLSTNNGCPPDSDNDGVADEDDKCPDLPGEVQSNGCPNADTDGDGLFDKDDDCIFTSGPSENKGCPAFQEDEKQLISNASTSVAFEDQTTELKSSSYQSLDDLAAWLKSREQIVVKISSHTDNEGSETAKMRLSEERARVVKDFLANKGVNPLRISTAFFGGTKPIADNNTAEGRKQNNRIELLVKYK
jgi:outer membrane protein OmpA-like peptidoglycan-associated protein